jgi:Zn-dependent oligopeptidase
MAADMFSLFKKQGLMNQKLGIHLRKEIYEQGSSRDETLSLEAFLGRPLSYDAFFESMGAGA